MILLQSPAWIQTVFLLLGGGTIGVIFTALIQWRRFRKKDTAESGKTDAEAAKLQAEASEIKAKAEVTIADAALKLAQRLSDECEMTRGILDRTQTELDKTIQQLHSVTTKLNFVQKELDEERSKNAVIQGQLSKLTRELEKTRDDASNKTSN